MAKGGWTEEHLPISDKVARVADAGNGSGRSGLFGKAGRADPVRRAVRAYRRAHTAYERDHLEIFSEVEQARLREAVERALASVRTPSSPRTALDIGCGTGNVTRHLLELGASVVAADVSPDFLRVVEERYGGPGSRVRTVLLNGEDLRGFDNDSFDLVCAYSVLHHVQDYLEVVREALRVLKPEGVLYIDHEVVESYWEPSDQLKAFRAALMEESRRRGGMWNPEARRWQRWLILKNYVARLRLLIQPRYQAEGDIHVFRDDHVSWDEIVKLMIDEGAAILRRHEYLAYRSGWPLAIYDYFASEGCVDMALLVARKGVRPTNVH
jgi:ubiquinone/menaquinone biosynthesis C-methylase UbiE